MSFRPGFRGLRACAAIAAALAASQTAAGAGTSAPGYYERAYDAAHLAAHKSQIVDHAWREIEPRTDTPPFPFSAALQFSVKGRKGSNFSSFGTCKEDCGGPLRNGSLSAEERGLCGSKSDGVRSCRVSYDDSGKFRIAAAPEGVLVTIAERLETHDAKETGADYLYLSPGNPENHAFLLKPADAKACK
jgi:hypothetical protein